jgi:hypothetical protein
VARDCFIDNRGNRHHFQLDAGRDCNERDRTIKADDTALSVLSSGMLCANLIGTALGFFGAKDRSSRKLYPLLGLTLNVAILVTFVVLALVGLSMKAP